MKDPLFSICIPNYNYGRYIGDTIRGVLAQTYQNFEIVVADNASTDDSVAVVESFNDPRIRLIRNRTNIGFAPNLQKATMYARGDYINLLSSDDQIKPHALETYAKVLEQLGDDAARTVLYSQAETFDDDDKVTGLVAKADDGHYFTIFSTVPKPEPAPADGPVRFLRYEGREVLKDSLGRLRSFAPFLTTVYPRALWEKVEGYNGIRTIGPDKHFNYKLLSRDPHVVYVPAVLYRYRDFASDNRVTKFATLKQAIDDYLYTLEFSEGYLQGLGLSKQRLIRTFVNGVCLKEGLSQLGQRSYANAFRLTMFALASYPGTALRLPRMYLLLALLALGPVSYLVSPLLYGSYKMMQPPKRVDPAVAGSTA